MVVIILAAVVAEKDTVETPTAVTEVIENEIGIVLYLQGEKNMITIK